MKFSTERKIYISLTILLLILFLCIAFWQSSTRSNFIPTNDALRDFSITGNIKNEIASDAIQSAASIRDSAELIVQAEATGNRELFEYDVKSEIQVTSVLKGSASMVGKNLYVYEPIVINAYPNNHYMILNEGYMLMQPQKSYLLYLKFFERPDGYEYSSKDLATYVLVDRLYSKFGVGENCIPTQIYTIDEQSAWDLPYAQNCTIDFFPCSQQELDSYLSFRKELFVTMDS